MRLITPMRNQETPRGPTVIATHEPIEGELVEEMRNTLTGELQSFTVRRIEHPAGYRDPIGVEYTFYARDGWTLTRKPL